MPKAPRRKGRHSEPSIQNRPFAVPSKQVQDTVIKQDGNVNIVPVHDTPTSKQSKKKMRHEAWKEKLDHAYALRKRQQKLERIGPVANFDSFHELLNDISENLDAKKLAKATKKEIKPSQAIIPSSKIKHKKARRKAELEEITRMQQVIQHSAFRQNPLAAIRQHVQNTFTSS